MDGDRAALWIHGHMHESFNYEVYGTRVVCNPRGYAPEALNPDFRPDWLKRFETALKPDFGYGHQIDYYSI